VQRSVEGIGDHVRSESLWSEPESVVFHPRNEKGILSIANLPDLRPLILHLQILKEKYDFAL
jgi:hypothetical protein